MRLRLREQVRLTAAVEMSRRSAVHDMPGAGTSCTAPLSPDPSDDDIELKAPVSLRNPFRLT
jgi:hypothetical protein